MIVENWGTIHYETANRRQLEAVDEVIAGGEERLIVCNHPPIVTVGRGAVEGDIFAWDGEVMETARGGRATYHGPSQIIVYPIISLERARPGIPFHDVHAYLRALEGATVDALSAAGLPGTQARTTKVGDLSMTGVWVNDKKIASVGIAVKKWITYHGVAINVLNDEKAFSGINPCGFSREIMTSLEAELNTTIDQVQFAKVIVDSFRSRL